MGGDFFYGPTPQGPDPGRGAARYQPYLDGLASRDELTYLLEDALGEMTVGHMFLWGGEGPEPKKVKGGLLGADYAQENGRYRITKAYDGENWNPGLQAPLTQPGVNVKAGDSVLGAAGGEPRASGDLCRFFAATAGSQPSG